MTVPGMGYGDLVEDLGLPDAGDATRDVVIGRGLRNAVLVTKAGLPPTALWMTGYP